jgi:hypothetical protein
LEGLIGDSIAADIVLEGGGVEFDTIDPNSWAMEDIFRALIEWLLEIN